MKEINGDSMEKWIHRINLARKFEESKDISILESAYRILKARSNRSEDSQRIILIYPVICFPFRRGAVLQ